MRYQAVASSMPDRLTRTPASVALALAALVGSCASDVFAPSCQLVGSACWYHMVAGDAITSMAESADEVYVGTATGHVYRYRPMAMQLTIVARFGWPVTGLVVLDGRPKRLIAGTHVSSVSGARDAIIHMSDDNGMNWRASFGPFPVGQRVPTLLSMASGGSGQLVVAGLDGGVLASRDRGDSWVFVLGSQERGVGVAYASAVGPNDEIWVGGQDSFGMPIVRATLDSGRTWSIGHPLPGAEGSVYALSAQGGGAAIVGTGTSLRRTVDKGQSWQPVLVVSFSRATDIVVAGTSMLVIVDSTVLEDGLPAGTALAVYLSLDGGSTWSAFPTPPGALGGTHGAQVSRSHFLFGTSSGFWHVDTAPKT